MIKHEENYRQLGKIAESVWFLLFFLKMFLLQVITNVSQLPLPSTFDAWHVSEASQEAQLG